MKIEKVTRLFKKPPSDFLRAMTQCCEDSAAVLSYLIQQEPKTAKEVATFLKKRKRSRQKVIKYTYDKEKGIGFKLNPKANGIDIATETLQFLTLATKSNEASKNSPQVFSQKLNQGHKLIKKHMAVCAV